MSEPFLGEIRLFAGSFPPKGWAFCNGQIMPIQQNTALFSLLGVNYGGNGTSNYALPNLQGSIPIGQGSGPGLTPRAVGEIGGAAGVNLLMTEMAGHTHAPNAANGAGDQLSPENGYFAQSSSRDKQFAPNTVTPDVQMGAAQGTPLLDPVGGSGAHENTQPYLAVSYIIATAGIFPQRP